MDNVKFEFIKESIIDTQQIIRSIDVKAGAGLAILISPIAQIEKIWDGLSPYILSSNDNKIIVILSFLLLVFWLASMVSLIKVVMAIDNPANHIVNNASRTGCFYSGGLYDLGYMDVFLNREVIKANKDILVFTEDFNLSDGELIDELIFEKMKITYIRDVKMLRLNFGLRSLKIWSFIGLLIFIFVGAF